MNATRIPMCIKCGRPNDGTVPFIGPLCAECYFETHEPLCVPRILRIPMCKSCYAVKVGYRWEPSSGFSDALERIVPTVLERSVKPCTDIVKEYRLLSLKPVSKPSWRVVVETVYAIQLAITDSVFEKSFETIVYFEPTLCPVCKDYRGGEYNAVVQLRGFKDFVEIGKEVERIVMRNERVAANLLDIVYAKDGIDLYFYDKSGATRFIKDFSRKYRLVVKRTSEDVGVTSRGKMRRRLIFSARLVKE